MLGEQECECVCALRLCVSAEGRSTALENGGRCWKCGDEMKAEGLLVGLPLQGDVATSAGQIVKLQLWGKWQTPKSKYRRAQKMHTVHTSTGIKSV